MNETAPKHLDARRRRSLERLRRFSHWLDDAIRIPGIGLRVGADGLIGLVPVVGDFAGLALSSALVVEAARLRAPTSVIVRMSAVAGADFLVGLVPVVGDAVDVVWRANRRNVAILEQWLREETGQAPRRSWPRIAGIVLLLGAAAGLSLGLWRAFLTG